MDERYISKSEKSIAIYLTKQKSYRIIGPGNPR
jgi:hypothetical protein